MASLRGINNVAVHRRPDFGGDETRQSKRQKADVFNSHNTASDLAKIRRAAHDQVDRMKADSSYIPERKGESIMRSFRNTLADSWRTAPDLPSKSPCLAPRTGYSLAQSNLQPNDSPSRPDDMTPLPATKTISGSSKEHAREIKDQESKSSLQYSSVSDNIGNALATPDQLASTPIADEENHATTSQAFPPPSTSSPQSPHVSSLPTLATPEFMIEYKGHQQNLISRFVDNQRSLLAKEATGVAEREAIEEQLIEARKTLTEGTARRNELSKELKTISEEKQRNLANMAQARDDVFREFEKAMEMIKGSGIIGS